MPRDDWQDREDERRRALMRGRDRDDFGQGDYRQGPVYDPARRPGYGLAPEPRPGVEDFGQADYSNDYGYDPQSRQGYRRHSADDPDYARRPIHDDTPAEPSRSWLDRAGSFFGSDREEAAPRRRHGPSDRVLWAVIVERLEHERGLDLRGVEVIVEGAEVTLNGRVRRKADRRRIEDVADIDGVRHVQNNLRVHEAHWTLF